MCLVAVYKYETLCILLNSTWNYTRIQWWFKHDTFEPAVAFVSFGVWIHMFSMLDRMRLLSRYVIAPEKRQVDLKPGVASQAGAFYLSAFVVFDFLYPRRNIPEYGPGSPFKVLCDIALGIWLYDLIFFPVHLAFHNCTWLRSIHKRHHHTTNGLFSTEVLRHSLLDGTMQVLCNIVVLKSLGLHPFTRGLYNIVVTYLLTELHSGYNFPWMLHNLVPGGILGGPPRHEMHHVNGKRYFQQFFTYLDDWLYP